MNDDPLNQKDTLKLALILKESSVEDSKSEGETAIRSGTWTSKLHFAWDVVLESLLKTNKTDITTYANRTAFLIFWTEAVDSKLLKGRIVKARG